MRSSILSIALLAGVPAVAIVGCSTAPSSASGQQEIRNSAGSALAEAYRRDPTLRETLERRSAGFAVFPTVGEGGLIVGGGYGKGVVYEKAQIIGYCDMSSVSAGAKIGGKEFSEIIAFGTPHSLAQFKNGNFALDAKASAVALRGGSAASSQYQDGVTVFVFNQGGLMADASVGGQSFRFTPTDIAQQAASKMEGESQDHGKHQERLNGDTSSPDVNVDTNVDKNNADMDVKVR